mmetsp:Transcript_52562/g.112094  ORF Transcript_52562/g.112094 Transcript_52562/m.112094 type:complete len:84 (-) Transcript_52562:8-259(-)
MFSPSELTSSGAVLLAPDRCLSPVGVGLLSETVIAVLVSEAPAPIEQVPQGKIDQTVENSSDAVEESACGVRNDPRETATKDT